MRDKECVAETNQKHLKEVIMDSKKPQNKGPSAPQQKSGQQPQQGSKPFQNPQQPSKQQQPASPQKKAW